jgi:AI-2 transport protein TqsA
MSPTSSARVDWPLPRGLMILLGGGAAVLVIAGLQAASEMIAPIFLALVVTIAVHPIRGYLERRHVPGWASTTVGILSAFVVVIGLFVVLVVALARFATLLTDYQDEFNDLAESVTGTLDDYGIGQRQISSLTDGFDASQLVATIGGWLASLAGVLSGLFFIVTLLLFLGIDAGRFPLKLDQARAGRGTVVSALESFAHGTRQYLVVSTVFGFIVAVVDTTFLAFTPVPAALLWGVLAFITNYIPNIGFVIGLIPPAILGLVEGGPALMVLIIVVYSVFNFVIQSVIQPKFVGDAVGLSGSITFVSLVFWAWVMGPLGALFAVPLTLLVKALLVDVDRDSAWLTPLLSGSAATPEQESSEQQPQRAPDDQPVVGVTAGPVTQNAD